MKRVSVATVAITLRHGHTALIDLEDWPLVKPRTLYRGTNGYVYYSEWRDGKSQPKTLHGLLMGRHPGKHVDHINGDKLDNRRANLRVVTPSENGANRTGLNRNNTSGVRGVSRHSQCDRWVAQITIDRKNKYLGLFKTQDEAIAARRAAELLHFGDSA